MRINQTTFNRRGFCLCCVASSVTGWLGPGQAFAEARGIVSMIKDSAAATKITIHRMRGNVSVLEGSGGNIAVLTDSDGALMVDAGVGVSQRQIRSALEELSAEPLRTLINTHWHFDHSDGNGWLGIAGARIIAHEKTHEYLSQVQRVADWDYNFLPLPPAGLPTETISSARTLTHGKASLLLKPYAPAHTDSDLSVTFEDVDIVHVGDTFWNGVYPFIDYSTGGSINGMISATEATLASTTKESIIISGHGKPVGDRSELKDFHDMLVTIRDNVSRLKGLGMSSADAVKARPTKAFDERYGNFVVDPAYFTRLVYEGV